MLLRAVLLSLGLSLAVPLALPLCGAHAAVDPNPFPNKGPTFNPKTLGLLNEADKQIREGNLEEGVRQLNLAASLEPKNPNVLVRLAIALNMAGQYQAALDRLHIAQKLGGADDIVLAPMLEAMLSMGQNQIVLDLYPDPGPDKQTYAAGMILRARASALEVLGDSAGASAAMKRSLAILKDYDGVMTAARISLLQGDYDSADTQAEDALKIKPGDIDAQMLKVDLAMQRGTLAVAQQMAERLVADNPRSVSALLMRIKVYISTGRTDKAEADVDRIMAAATGAMPIVRYYKAVILARHGDAKGAWAMANSLPKEYLQLDPGVALNVGRMAIDAGYVDSGASILSLAVLRFPWQIESRLLLADVRLRQNSPEHALNALTMVKDSKDPRVSVLFARAFLLKKDRAGAQKYIESALDAGGAEELRSLDKDTALKSITDYMVRHPANKLIKKQYALLLLSFGEVQKARATYEQLVREDTSDGLAFNNLSWLVVHDDPARALTLAQQAVKIAPSSANFLDTLGSMQMTRSDNKGAVVSLQKARELAPDDPQIAYHLALALEATGQGAQSQAILQQLVKRGGFGELDAAKNLLASKLKMAGQTQAGR
jgi:tetratricopeptide (TPR) repeat protein